MKVLELCLFSAGGDGVYNRVKEEAILLSNKGNEVRIFSSNKIKGKNETSPLNEKLGNVKIQRFKTLKGIFSESFMLWPSSFKKAILEFNPDVIIAHSYRHSHTSIGLTAAKKMGAKCFIVTHAPFDRSSSRNIFGKIVTGTYDSFIGPSILKRYNKIITISHWEESYLKELGVSKDKIVYIPNGINEEFFTKPTKKSQPNKIIYTGRIAPIKNLEIVSKALNLTPNNFEFEIYGPAEQDYLNKIRKDLYKYTKLSIKSFNKKEQISALDSARFFILPSKSEGMPQSLIEAMARGKICIASDNPGSADLIQDGKNGFLFKNGDVEDLSRVLNKLKSMSNNELDKVGSNAKKFAEQFKWSVLIKKLNAIISSKK